MPPVAAVSVTKPLSSRLIRYDRLSDRDLVTKANGGDSSALDALLRRHAPKVQRLTAQLLDVEDARDAAQESLAKLCTRLRQFRGEAQFTTWLHRLVVTTCADLRARQWLRQADGLERADGILDHRSDPSRLALLAELRRDLVAGLGRLSRDQRAAVLLRDTAGLSYEEIARVARLPVGTVKSYVHRARRRLRRLLEEHVPA